MRGARQLSPQASIHSEQVRSMAQAMAQAMAHATAHAMEIYDLLVAVRKGVKPAAAVRAEIQSKVGQAHTAMRGAKRNRFDQFADEADAFLRLCEIYEAEIQQQEVQNKWQMVLGAANPVRTDNSGLDLWLARLQTRAERL